MKGKAPLRPIAKDLGISEACLPLNHLAEQITVHPRDQCGPVFVVARELSSGPKRYSQLLETLSGIGTSLLAA